MTKKTLVLATLFALASMPGMAQTASQPSPEEMAVSVNWQNLQNAVIAMLAANKRLETEVAALKEKCGDACKPSPSAQPAK